VTKGRFKRGKRAGGEPVLTLTLESKQIPWDEVPFKKAEAKNGEFDALARHLQSLKVTFSLGIKGDYLLFGVTAALADLDKLGGEGKKLVECKELAPMAKHATERVTMINYASAAYNTKLLDAYDLTDTVGFVKRLMGKSELPAPRRKVLEQDLDDLAARVKKGKPAGGALVGVSYLTADGWESYLYEQGDHSALKGKRLELLDHFGGSPVLAAGTLVPSSKMMYMQLVGQVRSLFSTFATFAIFRGAIDGMESSGVSKEVAGILQKLIETTSKQLLPALRDGEMGVVLDARWKSKKWWSESPAFTKPLPMLEAGLLLGVQDAEKFTQAMKDYRLTLKEGVEKLPERERAGFPFTFGAPEMEKTKAGTLYLYPLPESAGLDRQFKPTGGVGKSVAVFTLSRSHTERLLTPTPLKSKPPTGRKDLLGFAHFDFPALLDAVVPWAEAMPEVAPPESKEGVRKYVKDLLAALELLKAFQGFSSATYLDGDILVTHSQVNCKDR
jgi:hypothetical protein